MPTPRFLGDDSTPTAISGMQKAAAWLYFASLVYALGLWGWSYSAHTVVAPVISSIGQSILGLFGG